MFNQPTAWRVDFGNKVLNASFRQLDFAERADGGWSVACHTFTVIGSDHEAWIDAFAPLIEKADFKFRITDVSDEIQLPEQNHIILKSSLSRKKGTAKFEVVSIEKRALMLVKPFFKFYDGGIGQIVRQAITDSGVEIGEIEEPKSVDEYKSLHNPGWSSHKFITEHLKKRSVSTKGEGGFVLWSTNGNKVNYGSPSSAKGDLRPDDFQIDDSERKTNYFPFASSGGASIAHSTDPLKLKPIKSESKPPGREENSRFDETKLNTIEAARSEEALKVLSATNGAYEGWLRVTAAVTLFGDRNCGVPLPVKMSLQRFKEVKGGIVVARTHLVKNGKYTCEHHLLQR